MIKNLKKIESTPIARTNIIKLNASHEDTLMKLLKFDSNLYQIDVGLRSLKKEKKESYEKFYNRLHGEIKNLIRTELGLNKNQDVKYELINIELGLYVYFFIRGLPSVDLQAINNHQQRIEKIILELTLKGKINSLIQGLFALRFKIALLEKISEQFEVEPTYFNSEIYLNARFTPTKGKSKGYIDAFRLSIYASDENEVAFTLRKNKFLVLNEKELSANLEEEPIWFNTASGRENIDRKVDARDSKLTFFKAKSEYGESQAYTYNVVMNQVKDFLLESELLTENITFQATHEVDNFATDLDVQLSNPFYIYEPENCFNEDQRNYFKEHLQKIFTTYQFIDQETFKKFVKKNEACSILVLNLVNEGSKNSIHCSTDDTDGDTDLNDDDTDVGDTSKETFSFWQAYEKSKKAPEKEWDLYTNLKIKRLNSLLDGKSSKLCLQGMNIDSEILNRLNSIIEIQHNDPEKYEKELLNKRSLTFKKIKSIRTSLKRIKTELWFKETLLTTKQITNFPQDNGDFTAFYIRSPKNADKMVAQVRIEIREKKVNILEIGIVSGEDNWIKIAYSELERVDKFYNDSFYLYDHNNDTLLGSYNSERVPRIIGSDSIDQVEWYLTQEREKQFAESAGKSFSEYLITRSAKPDKNVLPYYINKGRTTFDPMTKPDMKYHRIYLMSHKEGLYYLVTHAQSARMSIARQNLIENIIILDGQGKRLEPLDHPLTGIFLNSFTLDMLRSGESSKLSIFEKLAKLIIEN